MEMYSNQLPVYAFAYLSNQAMQSGAPEFAEVDYRYTYRLIGVLFVFVAGTVAVN